MGSLLDCLRIIHAQTGPNTALAGILLEGHSPPDITTPAKFLFYNDIDTQLLYFNSSRDSDDIQPTGRVFVEVGGAAQDMEVAWTPTSFKLGEMLGFFTFGDIPCPPGSTIVFEQATSIAGFDIESTTNVAAISFPNLVSIDPLNTQGGYLQILSESPLILTAALLATIATALTLSNSNGVTANLPSLITVGTGVSAANCTNVTLNLPALVTIMHGGGFNGTNSTFVALNLSAFLPTNLASVLFTGSNLTAAMVNQILARCVASAGYVLGVVDLSGGTNAAPTGQGITDKATLIGRGVTVTTN